MKVQALADGFARLRGPGTRPVFLPRGTVFEKPDSVPLGRWMQPVPEPEAPAAGPGPVPAGPATKTTRRRGSGDVEVI